MKILGNILWFIFGGFLAGLGWLLTGLLWCCTIIGIPVGKQCFKLSAVAFFPFGKEIIPGGKAGSLVLNILWLIFGGFEIALTSALAGLLLCCTLVGIPFGIQHFKLAQLALGPFGARIK
ncbi:YccF domain-containing protein [Treponema sp. HNW]|uniref:YccF domain-containing protein n=1 Tax=Treponema sp. HNW TaxID=3116654 RepID=UPI003D1305FC